MGIGAKNLLRIRGLCERGLLRPGASIIELGAQEIYCKGMESDLADFVAYFADRRLEGWRTAPLSNGQIAKLGNRGFASALFKACGFEYHALDIFDGDGVILFDLNMHSTPPELAGRFDLVTNFGTTEHLINQYLSMKTVHELAKPGAIIYHDLPMGGYHTHGYFSYNPMFFEHLAQANGYEILLDWYSTSVATTPAPHFMKKHGYSQKGWLDHGMEYILRKTSEALFRMPLETSTSLGVNPAVWGGSDPYGREREAIAPVPAASVVMNPLPAASGPTICPATLAATPARELQRELARRYVRRIKRLLSSA